MEELGEESQVIGVCGYNGAGKSTACRIIQRHGYKFISLSDFIKESLYKKGIECTRENMIHEGNILRLSNSPDYLAKKAVEKMNEKRTVTKKQQYVIDSIRNVAEVEYLRKFTNFKLVCIETDQIARYFRIELRETHKKDLQKKDTLTTVQQFNLDQKLETSQNPRGTKYSQQVDLVIDLADMILMNNENLEEFEKLLKHHVINK